MAAAVREPSERPFYDPAFGENLKAHTRSPLHDRQGPADSLAEPLDQLPRVAAIGKDHLQAWQHTFDLLDQQFAAVAILNVSRMDEHGQEQTQRIDYQVPLATFDLFTRVVPANPFFDVVFADWLSMMPTLGWGLRPSAWRSRTRSLSFNCCHRPLIRHSRK